MGCFANRGKRMPNLGGRAASRLNTGDKTRNLSLKEITDTKGPVSCVTNKPLCLLVTMRLISLATSGSTCKKAYNTNNATFKAQHWVIDPTTRSYNVEKISRERPENITTSEWDKYIEFWNDPRNIARASKNRQNRAKRTVISRQGSRSLAPLRDEMEHRLLIDTFFMAYTVNEEFFVDEDRRYT
nr:hypothetical protein [Tanacetum cinerariifolium]